MRPTNKLFLFALIIFLLFGTVPVIQAQTAATAFSGTITGTATCANPPQSYSGTISQLGQIDYWEIKLAAGQKLIIDVDAETNGSSLDAYLEVLDKNEDIIGLNNDEADESGRIISLDPYLELLVPADGDYYIGISSAVTEPPVDPVGDSLNDPTTGPYTFLVQCSDQPAPSEFTWPVVVGELVGATDSDTGSLIKITLSENAESTLPYDLGVGPIIDIEFDPSRELVFAAVDTVAAINDAAAVDAAVAVDNIPAKIVALDPISGNEVASYSLETELVVALEAAGNELYGIQVDPDREEHNLVLVTFDDTALTATLTHVFSFGKEVPALAYNQSEKVMYAANGIDLLKIDLALSPVDIQGVVELTDLSFVIASIDFSPEDVLYVVDVKGNLYEVTDLITGKVTLINPINASGGVNGLTFVVGVPPDVEPIKTICSSTLTSLASASSGTAAPKLSRFKLKKNPLHRAIGLFKFEGMEGETVTLNVELEAVESAEAVVEESSASELENSLLQHWKGKGRVFLGIRDSIPGLDFRERKKDQIPFGMSATLPADGTYYVMLIRPLLRFYKTDYCLTLESDMLDSQAWETFDVAWSNDDSEDDCASTSTAEPEDVQKSTETGDSGSADDGSAPVALSTTAVVNEPAADGGDPEVGQTLAETPVVEPVAETPVVEPVAETPVVEPVAETPVVEPVAEIPEVTKPVVLTPVEADPAEEGDR